MADEVKQLLGEGAQLLKDGKLDEAIVKLKAAVDLDPSHVQAHSYLGAAYAKAGQNPASVEQFQAAVDLDPDNPALNFNLGQAFESAGSKPRAKALYEKALALDPKYARAQQRLDALSGKSAPSATPAAPTTPPGVPPATPAPQQPAAQTVSMPTAPPPGAPRPMAPTAAPTQYGTPPQYGGGAPQYGAQPGYSPQNQYGPSRHGPSPGLGTMGVSNFSFAGGWKRWAAAFVDGLILTVISMGLGFAFGFLGGAAAISAGNDPDAVVSGGTALLQAIVVLIEVGYFVGFNSALGQTPGKMALGIRILKSDGSKISFGTALGRFLLQTVFALLTCGLAYIAILVNSEHRGWHDQIMDTVVVEG